MVLFLLLHWIGLGGVIVASLIFGAWNLALVNSLVFLMLIRLEMVLVGKRYTVPLPVYTDGRVGAAEVQEPGEEQRTALTPAQAEPMETYDVVPELAVAA